MLTEDQIKELQNYYEEYRNEDPDVCCDSCDKHPENNRLWWESGGYEYPNDGTTHCDECGYKAIHQYDDFDDKAAEEYLKQSMEESNDS